MTADPDIAAVDCRLVVGAGPVAPVHDRGRDLADTAVMIAEGGRVSGVLSEAALEDLVGRRKRIGMDGVRATMAEGERAG